MLFKLVSSSDNKPDLLSARAMWDVNFGGVLLV